MKRKRILCLLLCAALVLTLLPMTAWAYDQSYYDFMVTGDAPDAYLVWNDTAKTYTLAAEPGGGFYNVTLSGTALGANYCRFCVADGARANITLDDVEIRVPNSAAAVAPALFVGAGSEVNIYLKGESVLASAKGAGLYISAGATVRIYESPGCTGASLYAVGSWDNTAEYYPGIDVSYTSSAATLEIHGGITTAVGSEQSAGIGGGPNSGGGNIRIYGGLVTAMGHYGAGIGSGQAASNCGNIIISGGIINAASSGTGGAGIGSGDASSAYSSTNIGNITINGGLVTAVGGNYAAGIGGGYGQDSGVITITGGTVIARGQGYAAGIGGGTGTATGGTGGGNSNAITISGGTVFASSGNSGGQDIGRSNLGTSSADIMIDGDPGNPAVFLRNNTIMETAGSEVTSRISPGSYAVMSQYGIELSALYPADRPQIAGTDVHGTNWLNDLWDGQISWWNAATNVGAYLDLKTIRYSNSQVSGSTAVEQKQHRGTVGTIRDGSIVSCTGYQFVTWISGEPAVYAPGTSYTFNSDLSLDASWLVRTYSIGYTLNNGEVSSPNPGSYTIETNDFTLTNPTRTGYNFAGWSGTGIGGTSLNVTVPKGSTVDRSYTANWTPGTYTVRYNANGGAGYMGNTTHTYDEGAALRNNAFTRSGYSFAGWATSPGGSVVYSNGQNVQNLAESGVFDLYAKWTLNNYTINYNLNGGAVSPANPMSYTVEESADITLNNPTKANYDFAGWSEAGTLGSAEMIVTIPKGSTGNRTYTANWKGTVYSLNYNLNGGAVRPGNPASYTIEESADITLNNPTKVGYNFAGWTEAGVTGDPVMTVIIPKGSTGNRTYTANWKGTVYSLNYNLNGGAVRPGNPASYTIEESADITLNNPTKVGYNFAGWSEAGVTGDPVMTVTIPKGSTGNRTYTANWTPVISGLPGTFSMYTGGRVTWDVRPEGGSWDYDESFFSATFNSPATFTALKAGTPVITYTVEGVSQSVIVTIQQTLLPSTGQDDTWIWVLGSLAAICGAGGVLIGRKKRVKTQE